MLQWREQVQCLSVPVVVPGWGVQGRPSDILKTYRHPSHEVGQRKSYFIISITGRALARVHEGRRGGGRGWDVPGKRAESFGLPKLPVPHTVKWWTGSGQPRNIAEGLEPTITPWDRERSRERRLLCPCRGRRQSNKRSSRPKHTPKKTKKGKRRK